MNMDFWCQLRISLNSGRDFSSRLSKTCLLCSYLLPKSAGTIPRLCNRYRTPKSHYVMLSSRLQPMSMENFDRPCPTSARAFSSSLTQARALPYVGLHDPFLDLRR